MKTIYWRIGNKYIKAAEIGLRLARWATGAFVAKWAFQGVNTPTYANDGLFASLNKDARDGLACLATIPTALPLVVMAASFVMVYGGLYTAAREVFLGKPDHPLRIDSNRGVKVNQMMAQLDRGWRMRIRWGWWVGAAGAGAVTVAVTGVLLRSSWPSWLAWVLSAGFAWVVLKVETVATTARYQNKVDDYLPTTDRAIARRLDWESEHPDDDSAMPLIYAYSGLNADEIGDRFRVYGQTGALAWTTRLLYLSAVVISCSIVPAPEVEHFRTHSWLGCLFVNLHDFAGVAEENLWLFIAAGVVLLALLPMSILEVYRKFAVQHRFPPHIVRQVLWREAGFAYVMWPFPAVFAVIGGAFFTTSLWLSAAAANLMATPVVGIAIFTSFVCAWQKLSARWFGKSRTLRAGVLVRRVGPATRQRPQRRPLPAGARPAAGGSRTAARGRAAPRRTASPRLRPPR